MVYNMKQIILVGIRVQIICDNADCLLKYVNYNDGCSVCKDFKPIDMPKIFEEVA